MGVYIYIDEEVKIRIMELAHNKQAVTGRSLPDASADVSLKHSSVLIDKYELS